MEIKGHFYVKPQLKSSGWKGYAAAADDGTVWWRSEIRQVLDTLYFCVSFSQGFKSHFEMC